MHILFLTDNFPPEGNAPATRTYEHAIRWVKAGHKVTVITCAPNFPEGKVFDGFKNKLYDVSNVDEIRVVRVKTYIAANEGFVKRILDYMSFMVAGFFAGLFQKSLTLLLLLHLSFSVHVPVGRCQLFVENRLCSSYAIYGLRLLLRLVR